MHIVEQLEKMGFKVEQVSPYHFRVNGRMEYWINGKNGPLTWLDLSSGEKGKKPRDQMVSFLSRRLQPEEK